MWWKLKFHYNLTTVTGTFNEDLHTFMIISLWILRMRNVLDKSCRENQNKNSVSMLFSRKSCHSYDNKCNVELLLQQWLREGATMLRYTYIACVVTGWSLYGMCNLITWRQVLNFYVLSNDVQASRCLLLLLLSLSSSSSSLSSSSSSSYCCHTVCLYSVSFCVFVLFMCCICVFVLDLYLTLVLLTLAINTYGTELSY
jgi:hypothetical protein